MRTMKTDKDAALKGLAGRIITLSYRDMSRFAGIFDARNSVTRNTADRLIAVAEEILGPNYNPNANTLRGDDE